MKALRPILLVVCVVTLWASSATALVNRRGFSGLNNTTTGSTIEKRRFSVGLFGAAGIRNYQRFNLFRQGGTTGQLQRPIGTPLTADDVFVADLNITNELTRFVENAEVDGYEVTIAGGVGFDNDFIEIGFYITHQSIEIDYDETVVVTRPVESASGPSFPGAGPANFVTDTFRRRASDKDPEDPNNPFRDKPTQVDGISYVGLGLNTRLFGPNSRLSQLQYFSSAYLMVHTPVGDEFDGLNRGGMELELGLTFSKRFGNLGLHADGSYRFIGSETDAPFDGELFGYFTGRFTAEWYPIEWMHVIGGFHMEEDFSLEDYARGYVTQQFDLGMRILLRGEQASIENIEDIKVSNNLIALQLGGTYGIDEGADEEPLGIYLGVVYGPRGVAGTPDGFIVQGPPQPEGPDLLLIAKDTDADELEIVAVTTGIQREATYIWTLGERKVTTSTPKLRIAAAEAALGVRCVASDARGQAASDYLTPAQVVLADS